MKTLNQYQRNAVMYLLEQQETLARSVSFTPVFNMGVTEEQVRLLEYVSKMLCKAPFLTIDELLHSGMNTTKFNKTIGCLDEFKNSLGLSGYGFSDWLTAHGVCYSSGQKITIPYMIYQMFFEEIEKKYSDGNTLINNLTVELSTDSHYSSVSLFKTSYVLIPTTDQKALHLTGLLLTDHYFIDNIDIERSCLTLINKDDGNYSHVEVRCLSSHLSQSTSGGICVHDDIQLGNQSCSDYVMYPLSKLIDKHHRKYAKASETSPQSYCGSVHLVESDSTFPNK
ncbi:hypothetical protein FCV60_21955 [Vibrio sp. F13]|uniref:hypothetical protein n=1 Tax=Vibrio sp. F13 TaxID=2070777 RepID=UPI0010BE1B94|nr:hypothetical protein [Vibrio sp. F13]TKF49523.1 hypothetical protein FCV60_21955 [Vibrio sp. F13]